MSENSEKFTGKIIGVITTPQKAFISILEEDLWKGLTLILLLSALTAWAGITYNSKADVYLPYGIPVTGRLPTIIAIGDGIGIINRWLISSCLIVLIAKVILGEGNSKRMFTLMGFAYVPLLFQQLLRSLDAKFISKELIPSLITVGSFDQSLNLRLLNILLADFTVFGLWVFVLTFFAVSENYQCSRRKAAVIMVLAYLIFIAIRLVLPL